MTTPEQIAAAKTAYEQAQEAQKAAAAILAGLLTSHADTVKAYTEAKAAYDALKPATDLAKAKLKRADADVSIARAEYQAVAPKEVAADNAARKGTGNKELLTAVTAYLATKPDGATNAEIYDALVSGGVTMAGADPRSNLNSYLSRWGSAGSLVDKGTGKWGVGSAVAPAAPPAPQNEAVTPSFVPPTPLAAPPSFVPPSPPVDTAPPSFVPVPDFVAVEQPAPPADTLGDDFPGVDPLNEAGLTTRAHLAGKTHDDLIAIPGIGAKTADKILAALAV